MREMPLLLQMARLRDLLVVIIVCVYKSIQRAGRLCAYTAVEQRLFFCHLISSLLICYWSRDCNHCTIMPKNEACRRRTPLRILPLRTSEDVASACPCCDDIFSHTDALTTFLLLLPLLLLRQSLAFSQALNNQLLPHGSSIDIPHVIRRRLEMARRIVTLGDEDAVTPPTLQRLIQRDRRAHELLLDLSQTLQAGLQLQMVVGLGFGDGGDDGDVVALGADVVGGRDHGDVDVVFAADLGLRDDELEGVGLVGAVDGVVENADGFEEVADYLDFAGEVGGVAEEHFGFGGEGHAGVVGGVGTVLHGGFDARDFAAVVGDLVDGGVEHVCAPVDGGEASKALGEFAEPVEGVDVG
jgi:hypothetical protein